MKQSKNYIGFVNDHSGSMAGERAKAAIVDYNANITAVKDSANAEMLDTVVSVVGLGVGKSPSGTYGCGTERQVVVSNPHVLKPVTDWPTPGNTPLYDGVGDMIELLESLPDANAAHVSFLVMSTTDGGENGSKRYSKVSLRRKIEALQATGRWTFVFRVPKGHGYTVGDLGVPAGNITEWETTAAGMAKSTAVTAQAIARFSASRSAGQTSSTVFYAQAGAMDTSKLVDITKEVSLYVVPALAEGEKLEIRDFILLHRMEYLKGSAFYQLTKTESKVAPAKMIAVRDRSNGKIYAGKDARTMLGLPDDRNVRLHPGDHGNFDIFIQSSSVNRHLVGGTGVLYWKAIGVPFTAADLAYLQPKPATPAVVQLPAVPVSNKPTPSPLKKPKVAAPTQANFIANTVAAPAAPVRFSHPQPISPADGGRVRYHVPNVGAKFYDTRDMARAQALVQGKKQYDAGPTASYGKRFFVA